MKRIAIVVALLSGFVGGVASGKDNDQTHREQQAYKCITDVCLPAASNCTNNCMHDGGTGESCHDDCQGMADLCEKSCLAWNGL